MERTVGAATENETDSLVERGDRPAATVLSQAQRHGLMLATSARVGYQKTRTGLFFELAMVAAIGLVPVSLVVVRPLSCRECSVTVPRLFHAKDRRRHAFPLAFPPCDSARRGHTCISWCLLVQQAARAVQSVGRRCTRLAWFSASWRFASLLPTTCSSCCPLGAGVSDRDTLSCGSLAARYFREGLSWQCLCGGRSMPTRTTTQRHTRWCPSARSR